MQLQKSLGLSLTKPQLKAAQPELPFGADKAPPVLVSIKQHSTVAVHWCSLCKHLIADNTIACPRDTIQLLGLFCRTMPRQLEGAML